MLKHSLERYSQTNRAIIVTICVSLAIYVLLYFLWNVNVLQGKITDDDLTSRYKSICALVVVVGSCFLYKQSQVDRLSVVGKSLCLYTIYCFIQSFFDLKEGDGIVQFVNLFTMKTLWVFVYLFSYTVCRKGVSHRTVVRLVSFSTIAFFILFFYNFLIIRSLGIKWQFIESYFCLMMMPFIFLLKGKRRTILFFVVIVAILLSAKRTGSIALIISFMLYILSRAKGFDKKIGAIFLIGFLTIAIWVLFSLFFSEYFELLIGRFESISEDKGSGRGDLFLMVWELILKSDTLELIFGHGYNSVVEVLEYSAHNDFLEVMYDQGIIGLGLYVYIYISLIRTIKKIKEKTLRDSFRMSIFLFFIVSLTSHLILFTSSIICLSTFWGMVDSTTKYK